MLRIILSRRTVGSSLLLASLMFLTLPAIALALPEAPTDAAAMAELEAALAADASAAVEDVPPVADSSLMPKMALIFDGTAAWFSDRDNLQAGGHDPYRTGFNLQQLELHLESNVDPYLHMQANIVWGKDGVELEEAFAQSTALPWNLQVRAGKFLTPFGRLNPTHPHAWSFVDAPFALTKMLGPDGSRGLGTEVAWLAPLPWFLEVRAAASHPDAETGRSFAGEDGKTVGTLYDLLWTGNLRQFFALTDDWSLYVGVSEQQGTGPNREADTTQLYGADVYLRWRPVDDADRLAVSLQAEGLYRRRSWSGQQLNDWAGYAQVVADLNPHWQVAVRDEQGSGVQDDPLDPLWTGHRQRYAAQVTWFPSHFARIRLQGSADIPSWRDQPIFAGMLALETVIGAHGAHAY